MTHQHLAAALLATVLGAASAQAAPAFDVTATFEPFLTANASITVRDTSAAPETNVTVFSGAVTHLLGSIAPGASVTYVFNDVAGPFVVEPGSEGVSDATTYGVRLVLLGQTLTSNAFSPVANLTGGYVDFLGACYEASVGCSANPAANYPLSAVVATAAAAAPVPEPASIMLIGAGLAGLAARRRR